MLQPLVKCCRTRRQRGPTDSSVMKARTQVKKILEINEDNTLVLQFLLTDSLWNNLIVGTLNSQTRIQLSFNKPE